MAFEIWTLLDFKRSSGPDPRMVSWHRSATAEPLTASSTVRLRGVSTERLALASSADRETLARHLLRARERPVAWCVLDPASEATAALADLLAASWGPGLCYLAGARWADPTRPAVLPKSAGSRMLREARARVWWSESEVLNREHVMESLEHGCLPLQVTPGASDERGETSSQVFAALLLHPDQASFFAPISDEELRARLDVVAAALANGALERELSGHV